MADDEQQLQGGAEEEVERGDGLGNNTYRARRPRHIVGPPPSPVWVREDDGKRKLVERTPLNVILWDLEDPFLEGEEEDEGEDDDMDGEDAEEGGEEEASGAGSDEDDNDSIESDDSNGFEEEEDDDDNDSDDVDEEEESVFGEDDHDSVESDDENNVVDVGEEAVEPRQALRLLDDLIVNDAYWRYRLRDLAVTFGADVVTDWHSHADVVRHFVEALEAYLGIKKLHITRANFGRDPDGPEEADDDEIDLDLSQLLDDDDDDDNGNDGNGNDGNDGNGNDDCLKKLFGTVLCDHDSLEEITFSDSRIPTEYWRLFTENFLESGPGLVQLSLASTPLNMERCQLLKRMLQRKVWLDCLCIEDCGLGPDEWRVVCEGIAGSGGRVASVTLTEGIAVLPGTLLPLLQLPSAVVDLDVHATRWSDGAFEELVRVLRTNECLRDVTLHCDHDFPNVQLVELVEELLTTYNCTLETFTMHPLDEESQGRINALLERNRLVGALGNPADPTPFVRYHLSRTAVWPLVLEEYCRLPTQLYRFLRLGNLESFASQVDEVAANAAATAAAAADAAAANRMYRFVRDGNLDRFARRQVDAAVAAEAAVEAEAAAAAAEAAVAAEAAAAAAVAAAAVEAAAAASPRGMKRRRNLISK